jgi:predicted DNA-binding protein with PD1-like motif
MPEDRIVTSARFVALRLCPGEDLRGGIEAAFLGTSAKAGFVAACVGSLSAARLRFADRGEASAVVGPLEILSMSGTLSPSGPHLHLGVADADGRVAGGHLLHGCPVRTTAEIVLGLLTGLAFSREADEATGWMELVIRAAGTHALGLAGPSGGRDSRR